MEYLMDMEDLLCQMEIITKDKLSLGEQMDKALTLQNFLFIKAHSKII